MLGALRATLVGVGGREKEITSKKQKLGRGTTSGVVCPTNNQTCFKNYKFLGRICRLNLETTNLLLFAS